MTPAPRVLQARLAKQRADAAARCDANHSRRTSLIARDRFRGCALVGLRARCASARY